MSKIIGYKERSGVLDNGRSWSHVMVYTISPSDKGIGDECDLVKVDPTLWEHFIAEYGEPLGLEVLFYYNKFGKVVTIKPIN